jgi:hypothetical protein
MDAASNRGVDEMASLLEQAIYAPSNARFKVYMIDEVHMLTNHAFNAMLKTLEEPPEHVKFILATTDPQKFRSRSCRVACNLISSKCHRVILLVTWKIFSGRSTLNSSSQRCVCWRKARMVLCAMLYPDGSGDCLCRW